MSKDVKVSVAVGMAITDIAYRIAIEVGVDRRTARQIEERLYERIVTDADHEAYVNKEG